MSEKKPWKQAAKNFTNALNKPTPTPAVKSQGPREWKVLEAYDDLKRPIENGVDDCYYRLRGPEMSDEDINTTLIEKSAYEAMERELAEVKAQSQHRYDWAMAQQSRADKRGVRIEELQSQLAEANRQLKAERELFDDGMMFKSKWDQKNKRIAELEAALGGLLNEIHKEYYPNMDLLTGGARVAYNNANKTLKGAENE